MDLNYLKSKGIYILTAIISIFLVMYIGFQMKITADDEIYTEVVDVKTVSVYTELSGYLFLNEEELYLEGRDGVWISHITDGTLVDKNTALGAVYEKENAERADKIKEIDKKILMLETCMKANQGIIGSKEYDKAVQSAYLSLMSSGAQGDLFSVRSEMNKWLMARGKKDIAINIVASYNTQINALKSQRDELMDGLGAGTPLSNVQSGRYYASADGYGAYFSYELAKTGTYDEIDSLLKNASTLKAGKEGATSCGKLLYSARWYFITPMAEETSKLFKQGASYSVEFEENGGKTLSLTYEKTLKYLGNDTVYGVFFCTDMPEDFEAVRFQNVRIKTVDYEGLCISTSSVRYLDGEVGVYIAKGSKAEFRRVKIIAEKDGSYIVKGADTFTRYDAEYEYSALYLTRYDTVITSGKNIYQGKYIDMSRF